MKYSLRDIYDFDNLRSVTDTRQLMEEYGLLEGAVPPAESETAEAPVPAGGGSSEGTSGGAAVEAEASTVKESVSRVQRSVNRDDLVLDRWRKLAGL